MVLIGLLGKKHSGKDTSAEILINKHNFTKLAFADPLKNICKELFGFSDYQLYNDKETIDEYWNISPRNALQYLGTDVFRNNINKLLPNITDNFWVMLLENKYKKIKGNVIITDVRFQNEVDMIHKNGGFVIKINRNTNNIDNHDSEKYIDSIINYDYVIDNNDSIENLFKNITNIIYIIQNIQYKNNTDELK
jgi:dephospho-CoA kinase